VVFEPPRRHKARHHADNGSHEQKEAKLAQYRTSDGRGAVDGGQQDVAHLGTLEGERAAPTARPQADGHRNGNDRPQPVVALSRHPGHLAGGERTVADSGGQQVQRDGTEDRGHVSLVHGVDPMDVGQPLAPPVATALGERKLQVSLGLCGQHRRATLPAPHVSSTSPLPSAARVSGVD